MKKTLYLSLVAMALANFSVQNVEYANAMDFELPTADKQGKDKGTLEIRQLTDDLKQISKNNGIKYNGWNEVFIDSIQDKLLDVYAQLPVRSKQKKAFKNMIRQARNASIEAWEKFVEFNNSSFGDSKKKILSFSKETTQTASDIALLCLLPYADPDIKEIRAEGLESNGTIEFCKKLEGVSTLEKVTFFHSTIDIEEAKAIRALLNANSNIKVDISTCVTVMDILMDPNNHGRAIVADY